MSAALAHVMDPKEAAAMDRKHAAHWKAARVRSLFLARAALTEWRRTGDANARRWLREWLDCAANERKIMREFMR